MTLFTYTPSQADACLAESDLACYPWHHYSRRPDSTLDEFEIDQQGTHQGLATQADCAAHWLIVTLVKCTIQARTSTPHAWRDHRLRLIRLVGIPY